MKMYSIGETAKLCGVTVQTIRNWDKAGRIHAARSAGNQRMFSEEDILRALRKPVSKDRKVTVCYARVSTSAQKDDLERQVSTLHSFCVANGWNYMTIEDIGSGLNFNKKGLLQLIEMIELDQTDRIVLNYRDRLLRFGNEIIFKLCQMHGIEVVVVSEDTNRTDEAELAADVLSVITVFSARMYGKRSHKNKKMVQAVKEVMEDETEHNDTDRSE